MENFEERVNAQDLNVVEEETWMKKLFRDFSKYKIELENEMQEETSVTNNIERDLEPPLLDPTWGLEVKPPMHGKSFR